MILCDLDKSYRPDLSDYQRRPARVLAAIPDGHCPFLAHRLDIQSAEAMTFDGVDMLLWEREAMALDCGYSLPGFVQHVEQGHGLPFSGYLVFEFAVCHPCHPARSWYNGNARGLGNPQ